ncbi:hypothetical protein E4U42_005461 [Claviceps africana]|uniref:Kinetochore protein mis13 n=1 Tax=Claviceps africana TaxID=83212 RepID=A0A8K0NK13_9HYPO|nr:hypothetical protein E4U42_005461 [Claviceps africana]
MTTLVATQQVLELHSMSNQQERRKSKRRPAGVWLVGNLFGEKRVLIGDTVAPNDFECDDDFQFIRKSKRVRTVASPAAAAGAGAVAATTIREGETRITDAASQAVPAATIPEIGEAEELSLVASPSLSKPASRTGRRKSTRLKTSQRSPHEEAPQARGRTTRNSTRGGAADRDDHGGGGGGGEELHANGAAKGAKASKPVRRWEPSPTPRRPTESSKIALPMNDTPIINRNKEMRKKGGKSNRRSSLGSRGRRASSLIDNGQSAIPHREVEAREFYKHIAGDLPEPRRMKQLLMWCGERAMPERQRGKGNSEAVLGARAIQDQILKDFAVRSDYSNWFDRDNDAPPPSTAALLPNPRNVELDDKLAALEAKIQRLQLEKQAWQTIRNPPPDIPPIYPEDEFSQADAIILPDFSLLEPDEVKTRNYLADELLPFPTLLSQTETRLRTIQASLEFEIDQLADNVHKLEQRVLVAGKQADTVLSLAARRLKDREVRERESAGTREMPLMEVLRGLSGILPGNG